MQYEIESPLISQQLPMPTKKIQFKKVKMENPLLALCIGNLVTNACIAAFPPVFPPLADEVNLGSGLVGVIFGGLPLGSFLFSILVSIMLAKWGRKKVLLISLILFGISQVCAGIFSLIHDTYTFFGLNLLARVILGGARSGFSSTLFAYIPMLWPQEIQKKISITETFSGIGLIIGPLLSGVLTNYIGFQITFYIFGAFCFLALWPSIQLLPQDDPVPPKQELLSLKIIYKDIKVLAQFGLIMAFVACVCFVNPLLTNHLKTFGLTVMDSSFIFTAGTIMYILTLLTLRPILQRQPKTFILSMGLLIICLDCEIIGPEPLLDFPNKWFMSLIGLALNGVGQCLCILPTIPYLIRLILPKYPTQLQGVTDMSSGVLVQAYSLGLFLGPQVSGFIFQAFYDSHNNCSKKDQNCLNSVNQYAFYQNARIFFYFSLFFLVFFMTFGGGYKGWVHLFFQSEKKKKKLINQQSMQDLDQKINLVSNKTIQQMGDSHISNMTSQSQIK